MQILGGAQAQTEVWRRPPIHTRHGLRNSWFHFDFPLGSAEIPFLPCRIAQCLGLQCLASEETRPASAMEAPVCASAVLVHR